MSRQIPRTASRRMRRQDAISRRRLPLVEALDRRILLTTAIGFSSPSFNAGEDTGQATITLTRSGDLSAASTVKVSVTTGTAKTKIDYDPTGLPTIVNFVAGQPMANVIIPLPDDGFIDDGGSETLGFALSLPTGATLAAQKTAVLKIADPHTTPQIHFSQPTFTAMEGATQIAQVILTRTGDLSLPASVVVSALTGGQAASGVDYKASALPATVNFAAKAGSATLKIALLDDKFSDDGGSETLNLGLDTPKGATLGAQSSAVLTIADPHTTPQIQFAQSTLKATEGTGTPITLTLNRTGDISLPSSVTVRVTGGTAKANVDFDSSNLPTTVSFIANQSTATVMVPLLDDGFVDDGGSETLNFGFTLPVNATLGSVKTSVVTIADPHSTPQVQFSSATVPGTEGSTAVLTVTRVGDLSLPSSVLVSKIGGSAIAGTDYTATGLPVTLRFAAKAGSATVKIPLKNDGTNDDGGSENLLFTLSAPTGATLGTQATTQLNIIDPVALIQFAAANFSASETDGSGTLTLTRTGDLTFPSTAQVSITGGSAVLGTDYSGTGFPATVSFAAGRSSATVSMHLLDDWPVDEGDTESLTFSLSNPTAAQIGNQNMTTLAIRDPLPQVQFGSVFFNAGEGDKTGTLIVTRSGDLDGTSQITVDAIGGTAIAGTDYDASGLPVALTFLPQQNSKMVSIPLLNDGPNDDGSSESIFFELFFANGTTVGTPSTADLIISDPASQVEFSASSFSATEQDGSATIALVRTGDLSASASVSVNRVGGSASDGTDYDDFDLPATASFAAGASTANVTIHLLDDGPSDDGNTEELTLGLSDPTNATIGSRNQTTLSITDPAPPPPPPLLPQSGASTVKSPRQSRRALSSAAAPLAGSDFTTQSETRRRATLTHLLLLHQIVDGLSGTNQDS